MLVGIYTADDIGQDLPDITHTAAVVIATCVNKLMIMTTMYRLKGSWLQRTFTNCEHNDKLVNNRYEYEMNLDS